MSELRNDADYDDDADKKAKGESESFSQPDTDRYTTYEMHSSPSSVPELTSGYE